MIVFTIARFRCRSLSVKCISIFFILERMPVINRTLKVRSSPPASILEMNPRSANSFPNSFRTILGTGWRYWKNIALSSTLPGISVRLSNPARSSKTRCSLKPKNQRVEVFPHSASPAKTRRESILGFLPTAQAIESMKECLRTLPNRNSAGKHIVESVRMG
jgi:hypothetical protein